MPPWKTLLASPSHRKKEQQRERRKKSISGPLEIAVAPIGSIGRESPRPAPSPRFRSPRNSPALHSGHTSSATASPGYVIAGPSSKSPQLRRTVTAPAQCESPSTPPWHLAVEDGDSTTGEIELGYSPPPSTFERLTRQRTYPVDEEEARMIAMEENVAAAARKAKLDLARQDFLRDAPKTNSTFYTRDEQRDHAWDQVKEVALRRLDHVRQQAALADFREREAEVLGRERESRRRDEESRLREEAALQREREFLRREDDTRRSERHERRVDRLSDAAALGLATDRMGRLSMSTIHEGGSDISRPPSAPASIKQRPPSYGSTVFEGMSPVASEVDDTAEGSGVPSPLYEEFEESFADEPSFWHGLPSGEEWKRLPEEHVQLFRAAHPRRYEGIGVNERMPTPGDRSYAAAKGKGVHRR